MRSLRARSLSKGHFTSPPHTCESPHPDPQHSLGRLGGFLTAPPTSPPQLPAPVWGKRPKFPFQLCSWVDSGGSHALSEP